MPFQTIRLMWERHKWSVSQKSVSMVKGKKFNGIMPPQAYLTDSDIAAICTYIRQEFTPQGRCAVQPAEVWAIRK